MFQKKKIILSLFLLILLFSFCFRFKSNKIETIEVEQLKKEEVIRYYESPTIDILAILNIEKLSLETPIYPLEDKRNHVDKNVTILKESNLPDTENHELILASHSGNGPHAFFRNLDKLKKNDEIKIIFKNKTYVYHLTQKWEVLKTGTITLNNYNYSHLILITCSKTKENIQEIYLAKLVQINNNMLKN